MSDSETDQEEHPFHELLCRLTAESMIDLQSSSDGDEDILAPLPSDTHTLRQGPPASSQQPDFLRSSSDEDSVDSTTQRVQQIIERNAVRRAAELKSTTPATSQLSQSSSVASKAQREREKQEKKEQRERERREKREQKERAKQERQLQKQRERAVNQAAKVADQQNRKRSRDHNAQITGKFASKEIAVLVDSPLYNHERLTIRADLEQHEYVTRNYRSGLQGRVLQWIRLDYLKGGATKAVQELEQASAPASYQHLPVLAVVFDEPQDFIDLLKREEHGQDDDYPLIRDFLFQLTVGWLAAWKTEQEPRILVLLYQVSETIQRQWINYNRSYSRNSTDDASPPTAEELQDALTWMLMEFQVECLHCPSMADVSKEVVKMTRILSEEPYQSQVTELECVKKLKAQTSEDDDPFDCAVDTWERQLRQISGLGQSKARYFVNIYPTAKALWMAYQDDRLTVECKKLMCQSCFSETGNYPKLSTMLYHLMTSDNPNQLL